MLPPDSNIIDSPDKLLKLLLNPLHPSVFQKWLNLNQIEQVTRDWTYFIHKERLKFLSYLEEDTNRGPQNSAREVPHTLGGIT